MIISLSSGVGSGPTKLAAFDAALNQAGVANFNLIHLSSVIPAGSKIQRFNKSLGEQFGKWGDRLYVVIADMRIDTPHVEAWAGIGWAQDKNTGKGLFVEHVGKSKKIVEESIKASLKALMATRKVDYSPVKMEVVGTLCQQVPVCALVIATYQSSGWNKEDEVSTNG